MSTILRVLALLVVALATRQGAADLLTPIADGRYVFVDHCPAFGPCQSESAHPPSPFAPFDDQVAIVEMSASQETSFRAGADQSSMGGSLAVGSPTEPPLGNTLGDSVFDITFDATAAASYAWTGSGTLSGGGYGGAFLYDETSDAILFERSLPGSRDESGSLAAGHRYRIFLSATTLGQGSAGWDFDFSVLPEPDRAASLASGLALALLLARRRKYMKGVADARRSDSCAVASIAAAILALSLPTIASAQSVPGDPRYTEIGQHDPEKGTLSGSPTDEGNLPSHIRQLTDVGMRADWSPDGTRIIYLDGNIGDVHEYDLATGTHRAITGPFTTAGFLRAHHLSNGDLLLCGPPDSTGDPEQDRFRGELFVLSAPFLLPPVPLHTPCWEGVAVSKQPGSTHIAWAESDINFNDPDVFVQAANGRSQIFTGRIEYLAGVPTLVDRRLAVDRHGVGADAIVEPQDFRGADDEELIFSAYFHRGGEVVGVRLDGPDAGVLTDYSRSPWYEEPEGIVPGGQSILVERDLAVVLFPGELDIWRLTLDGSGAFQRLTHFNRYAGYGATNPVVSPDGTRLAFQLGVEEGAIGEGAGLLLFDLTAWNEENGTAGTPDPYLLPQYPREPDEETHDCEGPAGDPEPGTPEWEARDENNLYCGQQRHADQGAHPELNGSATKDQYREPLRHAGTRFRYVAATVAGLAAEIYAPCTPSTCTGTPPELAALEPPFAGVIGLHGGGSNKELHWWSSQSMAETGYISVAFDGATSTANVVKVLDWLFATPANPTENDEWNPFWAEFDREPIGIAGHSIGGDAAGIVASQDARVGALALWDRAGLTPLPEAHVTPTLAMISDYGCPAPLVCPPEPRSAKPDPDARGLKTSDFDRFRAAGQDAMQIGLRAALHFDWVPSGLSGNRYAELMNIYYMKAWYDRYVRGDHDPRLARDAYLRLTSAVYGDSADIHHISQGIYDPQRVIDAGGDLYAGNVPYRIAGMPASDRLSFYYDSKCDLSIPDVPEDRAVALDMRHEGCRPLPEPGGAAAALAGASLVWMLAACRRARASRSLVRLHRSRHAKDCAPRRPVRPRDARTRF